MPEKEANEQKTQRQQLCVRLGIFAMGVECICKIQIVLSLLKYENNFSVINARDTLDVIKLTTATRRNKSKVFVISYEFCSNFYFLKELQIKIK